MNEKKVQHELRSRFDAADEDGSGSLCYSEFVSLMSELKGDAIGPLRTVFTDGLQELLGVSLQMIALALSNELTTVETRPGTLRSTAVANTHRH